MSVNYAAVNSTIPLPPSKTMEDELLLCLINLNQKHHDNLSEVFVLSVQKTALTDLMNQNIPDKERASLNISGENS